MFYDGYLISSWPVIHHCGVKLLSIYLRIISHVFFRLGLAFKSFSLNTVLGVVSLAAMRAQCSPHLTQALSYGPGSSHIIFQISPPPQAQENRLLSS